MALLEEERTHWDQSQRSGFTPEDGEIDEDRREGGDKREEKALKDENVIPYSTTGKEMDDED